MSFNDEGEQSVHPSPKEGIIPEGDQSVDPSPKEGIISEGEVIIASATRLPTRPQPTITA